jgi:hypothetical protein
MNLIYIGSHRQLASEVIRQSSSEIESVHNYVEMVEEGEGWWDVHWLPKQSENNVLSTIIGID